jgi:hypothetical protein
MRGRRGGAAVGDSRFVGELGRGDRHGDGMEAKDVGDFSG